MSAAAGLLQGLHTALAMGRGPHWMLNDADAKHYGTALANALRHLPVTMAQKYVDYSAFVLAVFTHEAPRIAMDMRLRQQRQAQRQRPPQGPAQVFQFRPNPAQATPEPPRPPDPPVGTPTPDMTYEPELVPA